MTLQQRRWRWLLRLLPRVFREDYEREIVRAWRDALRDAPAPEHPRVYRRAVADVLRTAPREHLAAWRHNVRMSIRSLARARAFTAAAVLTLALGTGATAAVFSLLNAIVLRPLPWDGADAVGLIWAITPAGQRTWLSPPELEEIGDQIGGLTGVAGFTDVRFAYEARITAREADGIAVSHDFFQVLGVAPALGRGFTAEDDHRAAAKTVILGDRFWRSQFGADPAIVGRTLRLDDQPYTVIGVLPQVFEWLPASSVIPSRVDVWVALEPHLAARERTIRFLHAIGRLRPEATFASASAELVSYAARVQPQFAAAYPGGRWAFQLVSFKDDVLSHTTAALWLLFALVVLVLLMACSNVANLLLVRGEARRAELAVRRALGAGPARLAGELMAEAFVLAACAGVLGLGIAVLLPRVFVALGEAWFPRLDGVGVDRHVVLVVVALILLTGALAGLFPALDRATMASGDTLRDRSGAGGVRAARVGRVLVVAQTALATTVLVATVCFALTFAGLQRVDLGFDSGRLLTLRASVLPASSGPAAGQFFADVEAAIARVPGVEAVGAVSQLPLSGSMLGSTFLHGDPAAERRISVDLRGITPEYFTTMGIPLMRGRGFTDHDTAGAPRVVVVDETFARALDPGGDVIGRRVRWLRQPDVAVEVVGVVGAVRHRTPDAAPVPTVYRPLAQYPRTSMYFAIRTAGDPARPTADVTAAIAAVSRVHPVADVATMEQRVRAATSRATASATLTGILGVLALTLAAVGLYGVISAGVAQRRREFGVRLALGATSARVRRMVLREGAAIVAGGLVVGAAAGFAVVRAAGTLLFGVSAGDPQPYAVAAIVVLSCCAIAFWIPARRASRVDPATALRGD